MSAYCSGITQKGLRCKRSVEQKGMMCKQHEGQTGGALPSPPKSAETLQKPCKPPPGKGGMSLAEVRELAKMLGIEPKNKSKNTLCDEIDMELEGKSKGKSKGKKKRPLPKQEAFVIKEFEKKPDIVPYRVIELGRPATTAEKQKAPMLKIPPVLSPLSPKKSPPSRSEDEATTFIRMYGNRALHEYLNRTTSPDPSVVAWLIDMRKQKISKKEQERLEDLWE